MNDSPVYCDSQSATRCWLLTAEHIANGKNTVNRMIRWNANLKLVGALSKLLCTILCSRHRWDPFWFICDCCKQSVCSLSIWVLQFRKRFPIVHWIFCLLASLILLIHILQSLLSFDFELMSLTHNLFCFIVKLLVLYTHYQHLPSFQTEANWNRSRTKTYPETNWSNEQRQHKISALCSTFHFNNLFACLSENI